MLLRGILYNLTDKISRVCIVVGWYFSKIYVKNIFLLENQLENHSLIDLKLNACSRRYTTLYRFCTARPGRGRDGRDGGSQHRHITHQDDVGKCALAFALSI